MTGKAIVGGNEYALDALTDSLGFLTRVIQVQINDRIRASGGLGVSPACLAMFRLVEANPGIRQVDAARILLIQESNMANLIKDLVSEGLMERRGEAGTRRGGLWLTSAGRQKLEQAAAQARAIDRPYSAVLSDKQYRELLALLNKLYRASLG